MLLFLYYCPLIEKKEQEPYQEKNADKMAVYINENGTFRQFVSIENSFDSLLKPRIWDY